MANEVMKSFTLLYSSEEERHNPYVSPVCASMDELKGLPPALILPAERDSLKEEALLYAEHLKEAGVDVNLQIMSGMHHGYVEDAANPEVYMTTPEEVRNTHAPDFRDKADEAIRLTEDFLEKKLKL